MSALRCSTPCTSCIRRAFRKEVCRALLSRRPRCYNHATPTSIWYHPSNIQSSHPIDRKVRCPIPILKGLYPSARGCSRRATPGGRPIGASILNGLHRLCPLGWAEGCNPFRVGRVLGCGPQGSAPRATRQTRRDKQSYGGEYRRRYFTATLRFFGQGAVMVMGSWVTGWDSAKASTWSAARSISGRSVQSGLSR